MNRGTIVRLLTLALVVTATASTLLARGPSTDVTTAFEQAFDPYEAIHAALAADTLEGVAANARKIAVIARSSADSFDAGRAGVPEDKASQCQALLPEVVDAANRLARATTLDEAREAFGELSRPMVRWRGMFSGNDKPNVVFCPMARKPWLQESGEIANPYYGSKMLRCGDIVS